ncbi:hypothetical protein GCM10023334_113890 [Nonomuraea thailandensis]
MAFWNGFMGLLTGSQMMHLQWCAIRLSMPNGSATRRTVPREPVTRATGTDAHAGDEAVGHGNGGSVGGGAPEAGRAGLLWVARPPSPAGLDPFPDRPGR